MREILFKGKKTDGTWIFGNLLKTDDGICIIQNHIPHNLLKDFEVVSETVCQYTGLTDCNGNKIWEKDIIRLHDMTDEDYMVGWREDMTAFVLCDIKTHTETVDLIGDVVNEISYVEVIGNIFDNSELLDTTEK